jgi:hypothetical protein
MHRYGPSFAVMAGRSASHLRPNGRGQMAGDAPHAHRDKVADAAKPFLC